MLKIAIFSALPEEIAPLKNLLSSATKTQKHFAKLTFDVYQTEHAEYLLTSTGVGTAFASMITTLVIQHFQPDQLFFIGTAGAVHSDVAIRDVVIAAHAFEPEIELVRAAVVNTPFAECFFHPLKKMFAPHGYQADKTLLALAKETAANKQHVHIGTIATSNAFPAPRECYDTIKQAQTLAIDMETSAFYQAAWLFDIPALAVRGISNSLNADGTDDEVHNADIPGSIEAATKCLMHIMDALKGIKHEPQNT